MFGGDDDDDFTPGTSTKLASLFGLGKSSQEGNTSLTYTAPKQPKKGRAENQSVKGQGVGQSGRETSSSPAKLSIIAVKAVHTYKLTDGNYNAQGKLGAAVLGNAASHVYQLLLYKGKQQHVTSTRITPTFQFVVQANNYATFYDDQMQNWSMMFENSNDAIDFAKEVGLARGNAMGEQGDHNFVTQDLLFGVGSGASEGDSVEIRYIVFPLIAGKLSQEVDNTTKSEKPQRVKLKKNSWEEGLLGVAKGCKRMIVLTPAFVGPWKCSVPADSGVVLEVDVGRIKSGNKAIEGTPSLTDSGESAVDSSTDDTSIKARGASISEALTNSPKTHKASIISRMARMGQPTLPLTGAIVCNPSDSEETEEELSGPSVASKAPIKVRLAKSRPASSVPQEKPVQNVTMASSMSSGILPQHLAVYQPVPMSWQQPPPQPQHQFVRTNGSVTYVQPQGQLYPMVAQQAIGTQQVFPVPPTAISTPPAVSSPDSHMSVFLSETRTQNSEVRMGVAKVADKVDQVLMKLDSMQQLQHRQSLPTVMSVVEPSALLASIQKIVSENEQLRAEMEKKRAKIDQQNEKIYQLLHSNQKYLEQNSSMMEQRNDGTLQALVLTLQQEKAKFGADLSEALSRASSLELQVASADKAGQGLRAEVLAMSSQLKLQRSELEGSKQVIQELQSSSKSVADLQAIRDQLERKLLESTQLLQKEKNGYEQQINELVTSHQLESSELGKELESLQWTARKSVPLEAKCLELQQENAALKNKARGLQTQLQAGSSGADAPNVMGEVKKVMNFVFHMLQPQFVPEELYDGSKIRQILVATIRDVTLKYIEMQSSTSEKAETPSDAAADSRAQRKLSDTGTKELTSQEVAPQVPIEPAVAAMGLEVEDRARESVKHELAASRTCAGDISEKPMAQEKSDSVSSKPIDGSILEVADKPVVPDVQEEEESLGKQREEREEKLKQALVKSELQNPDDDGEPSTQNRAVSAKENGDITDPTGDILQVDKEKDKQSRESSLERSWRPQPPPPPLFDDDDDDDDWLS